MWITALLGMIITFAETVLGQIYRVKLSDGTYRGGPAYYVRFGLKSKVMPVITAFFYIIGVGLCIAFMQTNSIAQALTGVSNIDPIYVGIVVTIIAAIVTIGGVKRLTDISSKIVPVMAGLYILAVLFILVTNITKVPAMFSDIFKGAFGIKQAFAGLGGYTIMQAFRFGVARGLFSNDAGNGIAGIMHASADVDHPAEQGFLGMFGTFVTTIIICTLTAFAMFIILTKLDLHVVWGIIDVFVGIIVFISVISLFLLFRKVQEVMDDYEKQKRDGIEDPIWERNEEYKL